MNTQKHIGANPAFPTAMRLHTAAAVQAGFSVAGAKFTYISLNTPTACPPRTAVPVNRPFLSLRRCWVFCGHKFGQVCDFPNDVALERILEVVSLSAFFQSLEKEIQIFQAALENW